MWTWLTSPAPELQLWPAEERRSVWKSAKLRTVRDPIAILSALLMGAFGGFGGWLALRAGGGIPDFLILVGLMTAVGGGQFGLVAFQRTRAQLRRMIEQGA